MKYIKNKTIYNEGDILTYRIDESTVFAGIPTAEQLEEWGFEEYTPEPIPEPTEEEQERQQMLDRLQQIEQELQSMDYLTSKYIDGEDMTQYGDWQDHRHELRLEYREIENALNEE